MTILLDTCTLLWFVEGSAKLSSRAKAAIENNDNTPMYSIASVWEMAIKIGLRKLVISRPLYPEFADVMTEYGFQQLDISYLHASKVTGLPMHHRDPFDRLLIAQAIVEEIPIVSHDSAFCRYSVHLIW